MESLYKKKNLQFSGYRREIVKKEVFSARENSRHQRLSMLRTISDDNENNETKIPKFGQKKTGIPSRVEMLQKWKEEKLLKKQKELQLKKPTFIVGSIPKTVVPAIPSLDRSVSISKNSTNTSFAVSGNASIRSKHHDLSSKSSSVASSLKVVSSKLPASSKIGTTGIKATKEMVPAKKVPVSAQNTSETNSKSKILGSTLSQSKFQKSYNTKPNLQFSRSNLPPARCQKTTSDVKQVMQDSGSRLPQTRCQRTIPISKPSAQVSRVGLLPIRGQKAPSEVKLNRQPPEVKQNRQPPEVKQNRQPPDVKSNRQTPEVRSNRQPPEVKPNRQPPEVKPNQQPSEVKLNRQISGSSMLQAPLKFQKMAVNKSSTLPMSLRSGNAKGKINGPAPALKSAANVQKDKYQIKNTSVKVSIPDVILTKEFETPPEKRAPSFAPKDFLFRPPADLNFSFLDIEGPSIFSRFKGQDTQRTSTPIKSDKDSKNNSRSVTEEPNDSSVFIEDSEKFNLSSKSKENSITEENLLMETIPTEETVRSEEKFKIEEVIHAEDIGKSEEIVLEESISSEDKVMLKQSFTLKESTSVEVMQDKSAILKEVLEENVTAKENTPIESIILEESAIVKENIQEENAIVKENLLVESIMTEESDIVKENIMEESVMNGDIAVETVILEESIIETDNMIEESAIEEKGLAAESIILDESVVGKENVPEESIILVEIVQAKENQQEESLLPEFIKSESREQKIDPKVNTWSRRLARPVLESINESLETSDTSCFTPKTSKKKSALCEGFTPRRSTRLAEKFRRSGSFESLLDVERPSIMGFMDLDEPVASASTRITYDFDNLHLEDEVVKEKCKPVRAISKREASLLYTPPRRRRTSVNKAIPANLISFSPLP